MQIFVDTYKSSYKAIRSSEAVNQDFERWLEIATNAIIAIENLLKDNNLTRGEKYSLETSLSHLTTIKLRLFNLIKRGGELSSPNSFETKQSVDDITVKWNEVESAFKSRIKTGMIANLKHLDFNKFIDDAKKIFDAEVRKK